ncbi:unnamed protein product [Commensalibacter communis]|uniref:hypothetical protein n=1 Tax=Commensalibacter communis TaxID=2972786 RepID=UPI0022FF8544|nr:hypothetical protein [Commensalibacter communis]CAI3949621.1 unnamed protein product [Commensalibacter communis]
MNYFLKRLGCKEDRVSVGLHRLSIALIIWLWIALVIRLIIFEGRPYLIVEVCVLTVILYLFFWY